MASSSGRPLQPLRILMAACVPRRWEGGVAAAMYNLRRELEARGHSVAYAFTSDLIGDNVSARFMETVFAFRLAEYIFQRRADFDVVKRYTREHPVRMLEKLSRQVIASEGQTSA